MQRLNRALRVALLWTTPITLSGAILGRSEVDCLSLSCTDSKSIAPYCTVSHTQPGTVEAPITHTPPSTLKGMGYKRVWVYRERVFGGQNRLQTRF